MKNAFRLILSLVVSGIFLVLAFRQVDMAQVRAHLARVHVGYVALYVGSLGLVQIFRALRWEVLVRPFARLSLSGLMRISNLGYLLIMVLPLRLGELARPYLMRKEVGASFSSSMGAMVVERAIDGVWVTLLFFITTALLPEPYHVSPSLWWSAWIAFALFAAMGCGVVGALVTHAHVPRLLKRFLQPISPRLTQKAMGILEAFISGLRSLPSRRSVVAMTAWTLAYWVFNALGLYSLMRAFGWNIPVLAGFTVVCVLVIGIMIPAGPGFLGTYQASIMMGLSIYSIPKAEAVAYTMLAYPLNVAVIVAFGLPYLFGRKDIHLRDMLHRP